MGRELCVVESLQSPSARIFSNATHPFSFCYFDFKRLILPPSLLSVLRKMERSRGDIID